MKSGRLSLLLCALAGFGWQTIAEAAVNYLPRNEAAPAATLRVSNHHPFPIREAVRFQLPADLANDAGTLLAVSHSVSGGTVEAHYLPIQLEATPRGKAATAWIDVQLRPNESRLYTFQDVGGGSSDRSPTIITEAFPSGLPHKLTWNDEIEVELFDLALLEIVDDLDAFTVNRSERIRQALQKPLPAEFTLQREAHGPVKSTFVYRATATGDNDYEIVIRYDLFSSGITDIEVLLEKTNGRIGRGYLALAKRIPSQAEDDAAIQSEGEIHASIERDAASSGQAIHWFSWGNPAEKTNRAVMADFTPNLTNLQKDRYSTANGHRVRERMIGGKTGWVMLAEVSRENSLTDDPAGSFVLPDADEPVRLRYRVLPQKTRSLEEVDQAFRSFAGFQGRQLEEEAFHVSFGAGGVRFGSTYSPHSTVGEDWNLFKEEIRRDMRIANAMGLDWIRIQNFDSPDSGKDFLATKQGRWMVDYLGFMSQTAKETGLKIFLSFSLSPNDARLVAERFGETIAFYELAHAGLSRGVPVDRVDAWRQVHDAIKAAQPGATIIAIGEARSLSLLDRMDQLGIELDALGQNLAPDDTGSLSLMRDNAVALGGYASRAGKLPFASGDNWRTSVRQTEEAQANRFFEISDSLLSQRSVLFLLQSDLAGPLPLPSPGSGESRPFEALRLDRTATIQGHAYHEIIRRYGDPDNGIKMLDVSIPLLTIRPGQRKTVSVTVKNLTMRPLEIRLRSILPEGLSTDDKEETITLRPRQSQTLQRSIVARENLLPGVYHIFEEARFEDRIRLGWTYASHRAAPLLDLEKEPAQGVHYAGGLKRFEEINLSNLRHVVFGHGAPALEVNWALQLHNTLRSATGANIQRWADNEISEDQRKRSLLLVGNQNTNTIVAELLDRLPIDPLELPEGEGVVMVVEQENDPIRFFVIIGGKDSRGIEKAASDFLFRYWRHAKDAPNF